MNFQEYTDREMQAMAVANQLAGDLGRALVSQDNVSFCVAGGSTPGPVFDLLSAIDLDWSRVHILLSDERWVPEDHPQSNTALIKSRLMAGNAKAAQFVPFYRDGMSPAEGCAQVAPTLEPLLPLSVLMLGMGDDMHTASLFPGAQGTAVALAPDAPLLCPVHIAGQDIARVTLPAHALNGAVAKHLLITGAEKRAALDRAQGQAPDIAPVSAILDGTTIHWAA